MSLYNMMFGKNPNSKILLKMLNLNEGSVGRFRDVYLDKDGNEIVVFTRNGGGNRCCWEYEDCDYSKDTHGYHCMISVIKRLQEHPNYIKDEDDDFDCTYAYFHFSVPEKYKELAKMMSGTKEPNVSEKFKSLYTEMEKMSVDDMMKDDRFKPFVELFKGLTETKEE